MILIRGIKGEVYARKIEKGVVDCRDILSAVLQPPTTGYEYSDYYERNFVKALAYFGIYNFENLHNPRFLHSLLIDYVVPHIYLTYFHILNENSLEWLDKFEEDYQYIAINVKLDQITQTAIGNEYFGTKMKYVNSIQELDQEAFHNFRVACMCSIENLFSDKRDMEIVLQIYNTLAYPLLCREVDDKFTDIENEFRIIAYDCPLYTVKTKRQIPRQVSIRGKSGTVYTGLLEAGRDTFFNGNVLVQKNPQKLLSQLLIEEEGQITIDSQFKSIDVRDISDEYYYIGTKEKCKEFIIRNLKNKPKEHYVNRTIRKKYDIGNLENVSFSASFQKVDY